MSSRRQEHQCRKERVLGIVVNEYIQTINPISSGYIAKKYHLDVSSATIRNILAELEGDGFLMHPHTSAGRVPTGEGYRYYVDYLMHGEIEAEENLREYCIQEIAPEKYLDYMYCFLEGDGDDSSGYIKNGNDVDTCLAEVGINTAELEVCITETDEEYGVTEALNGEATYPVFDIETELNDEYGVQGSPTLVINGVVISSSRDPQSYLDSICSAFTDAPEVCETAELSSEPPSAYFGWGVTGATSAGSC